MRHHRWFVPRCISDPWYSCTPTRSCHRGLDKASLAPPLTPHPTRGDRVRHLSPLRGPHTAESSNARRKALCSRAVSRLENQCFDPKRGVLCERNPGRSSNRSLIRVDTRWIISSRFLEWINQRAIVIVSCVCCIWKRGWKYSKRRGVDARNCKKTIDLWTVFSSEDSYFSEFTFSLTT